jgi:16S rRNA C967 or C1407 C5-methylase (RsmB/RsmF family)
LNNLYKKSGEPGVPERYSDSSDKSDEVVIARLQAELEKQRLEHEVAIQTVRRETSGEINQLKKTIALIRNELEKTDLNTKEAVQNTVASTTDEIRNLKVKCLEKY